jgi:hypothetical protein
MHTRRYTHLTNAFSKKIENHAHAVALHMMAYNFVRIHGSPRCTPAIASGVCRRLWDISDIVQVIEDREARKAIGMAAWSRLSPRRPAPLKGSAARH